MDRLLRNDPMVSGSNLPSTQLSLGRKAKQRCFYLLTQAGYVAAIQLMWTWALLLVPSELLLSTHLPASEGWTAELAVGLWLVVRRRGFEPTRADLA